MCHCTRQSSHFDVDELEAAFQQTSQGADACATPPTPAARSSPVTSCRLIAELAHQYDTYVITDEVYEHIVYAPNRHVYFATLPGMWERTLSCSSLSKTYSITGWRLGLHHCPASYH